MKKVYIKIFTIPLENIRQIGCCCNLPFDTENALKVISQTSREYKDKAIKRLENYASSICMKCNNVLVDDGEVFQVQNTKDEYFRLRILFNETTRDPEKEIARVDHLICMKCVDKILKQDAIENNKRKKMGANININPAVKNIQCKICDEEHIIDIKEWNSIFKRNCCNGCFMTHFYSLEFNFYTMN